MHGTEDFSKTNNQLRAEGVESVEYAGDDFTGADAANELLLVRLDDSSKLDFEGDAHRLNSQMALGKPDGDAGYTYHGGAGGHFGLNREQAVTLICSQRGGITAVL